MGISSHARLYNVWVCIVLGKSWDIDAEAVTKRQERTALRAGLDDLFYDLDRHFGGPRSRVGIIGDFLVGNLLVARGQRNGGDASVGCCVAAESLLAAAMATFSRITYAAPAVPDNVQTNGPRLVP